MAFDDDDNPTAAPAAAASALAAAAGAEGDGDDALLMLDEEEVQDFRAFAAGAYRKNTNISAQTIRKGEKDFESHGTRAQENALEQSRHAMKDVLSYTRAHTQQNWARAWYFPDWWAEYPAEEDESAADEVRRTDAEGNPIPVEKKPFADVRNRVVVLESSTVASMNLGRVVTGQPKEKPARGKDWLLPEEALYLVERGSLDLWWPTRGLEHIFPAEKPVVKNDEGAGADAPEPPEVAEEADEYENGFPLSLEAAYSLLIGNDGERGKVSLQKFQVYSNLKRAGYNVLRAPPFHKQPAPTLTPENSPLSISQWLLSLLPERSEPSHQPYGPLVQPGLYRSYTSIFRQMALVPRHKPVAGPSSQWQASAPFDICYYIWKSAQKWSKTRHPPPDFYLAVVDAQQSDVPTLEEIAALLDSTPLAPGKPEWTGPARLYARLKHGHRNVLVAVVDHGIINYMRFAEGAFGQEELYDRFDSRGLSRGGKRGGRGGRGRGGRGGGGRGGGRGRGR
ncbi:hypothetical protein B0T22DRAFT_383640 [Podospora appendiculata]|uniref:tRNA-splicing endonuclease subunit Sen54 N-terminal domain-containing protein n=1 Tax=Podospora appendiculata TaxID=314037 RepID=A0AAE1C970_9PEZI|nr:hypothetical protein B0T22DRAFT_383640 [Podospora appendiculata]